MHDMDKNQHSVYLLYYHLIMVVKYRRKVISDEISEPARSLFKKIGENYEKSVMEPEHCLLTTGGATVDVIRNYIETQGEEDGRRKERRLRKYHEKFQGTEPASLSDAGEPCK